MEFLCTPPPVSPVKGLFYFPDQCAQLVGRLLAKRKVSGLIPQQGTCLGCTFGLWSGEGEPQVDVPLLLFLPFPLL